MSAGLSRSFVLVLVALLLGVNGRVSAEEGLAVGFEDFGTDLNLVSSSHPAAVVLRSATSDGLISLRRRSDGAPAQGRFELAIADSVQTSAAFDRWSFRIRRGGVFHSGRPISSEDVLFSLERCRAEGGLKALKKSVSRRVKTPYDALEDWIDLEVESGRAVAESFPVELSRCPIWEASSASLFGEDFGRGSNIVGSGRYRLVGFRPGKQYVLARVGRAEQVDVAGAAALSLRSFPDPARGLTALREGTVVALFTESVGVLEKAKSDETLVAMKCGGASVIRRRDLIFSCDPSIDVAHLRVGR